MPLFVWSKVKSNKNYLNNHLPRDKTKDFYFAYSKDRSAWTKPHWDKNPLGQNPTGQNPTAIFGRADKTPLLHKKGLKIIFEHFF